MCKGRNGYLPNNFNYLQENNYKTSSQVGINELFYLQGQVTNS